MENICKPCKPKNLCQETGCQKRCSFNFKGKTAIYCGTHKKQGMIDVHHKSCEEIDCKLRAGFNFKGNPAIYCAQHKKENMVNVNDKSCKDCERLPSYNFKGKPPIYCTLHKKENMICIKVKLCIENNCEKQPNFNFKNEKRGIYCSQHKKEDMVDIKHKICINENCNNQASFILKDNKIPIYCAQHKKEGMLDIKHKLCKTINCEIYRNKKYEGYCLFCFINTFPDKPVSKKYKTKEKAVGDYIKEQFKDLTLVFDKKTQDSCSKRRPDILLDLGYQVIIVEIDENQHEDYQEICENKRTMEISQDLGHRPVIFIRFNPDAYNLPSGKVTSCWAPNKLGILTIKKSKQKEWSERLQKLKETIEYWLNNVSENH
jgi:hypothetical protein